MRKLNALFMIVLSLSLMTPSMSAAEKTVEIGVAWFGKSGLAMRMAKEFDRVIRTLAPDIAIEYQKELASADELAKVIERWEKTKKGMVILRSKGARWLGEHPPKVPVFIGGCNHPKQLGVINNLAAPEGNITGVTYYLSADIQFEFFKVILPHLDALLLIIEEGHPSSSVDQRKTKAACDKMGIRYFEKACSSAKEAVTATRHFKKDVDAILLGNNPLVDENCERGRKHTCFFL